jgi:hypothetical protein
MNGLAVESSLLTLGADDLAARALTFAERSVLGLRWADRAQNELRTSGVFAEVTRALEEVGAPLALVEVARRGIDDEARHAKICLLAAEHYAREPPRTPVSEAIPRASFTGCSPREASVLYVALHCAINESVAAEYLRRCQRAACSDFAREATRQLLEDEVRHARLGFSFLASLSAADRRLVKEALPSLLATVRAVWLELSDYPAELPPGHGCLNAAALAESVESALAELVLPGFAYLGLATDSARLRVAAK